MWRIFCERKFWSMIKKMYLIRDCSTYRYTAICAYAGTHQSYNPFSTRQDRSNLYEILVFLTSQQAHRKPFESPCCAPYVLFGLSRAFGGEQHGLCEQITHDLYQLALRRWLPSTPKPPSAFCIGSNKSTQSSRPILDTRTGKSLYELYSFTQHASSISKKPLPLLLNQDHGFHSFCRRVKHDKIIAICTKRSSILYSTNLEHLPQIRITAETATSSSWSWTVPGLLLGPHHMQQFQSKLVSLLLVPMSAIYR